MIVFPVVYTNVLGGIEEVDTKLIEMAKVYRLSNVRKLRYIYFPQVFPSIRTACSLGLGMCWKAGIAAEVIGMPLGSVGERLQQAKIFLNTPDLFAWTLVIVVISVVFEKVFLLLLSMLKNRLERI
jgi:NitT/TauT family transport system permease protein